MDNLLAGIPVSSSNKKSQDTLVIPRQLSLFAHRFKGGRLHRNGWQLSNGMGGRLPPESVATLDRNIHIELNPIYATAYHWYSVLLQTFPLRA